MYWSVIGKTTNQFKPFNAIPGPKPLPFVGNLWRYLPFIGDYKPETLFENAQFNKKKYGPIVREQLTADHTILHLFDPDDIESFFRQDGKEPHRRSHRALLKYRQECPERYNSGGLFPENGSKWSEMRSVFQRHMLDRNKIARRASILDDGVIKIVAELNNYGVESENKSVIAIDNFEQVLQKWSLTCSLAIFLDYPFNAMPADNTLKRLGHYLHEELEAIDNTELKSERWSKKPSKCPYYQRLANSEKFLYEFVSHRIDYLLNSPETMSRVSYIRDWLLGDKIHKHDIISFILDSIMASFHTIVYTTTFMLKNISESEPRLKLALQDEIKRNLPPASDGPIRGDMTEGMQLLKDCLRETLRLNPVSIGTGRLTRNSMTIRGYEIPKNVMVIAQTQSASRDHSIFERADEFRPERWAKYRGLPRCERPSAFAYLPFGFGPRVCIGKRLVYLQVCTLVARILQRYSEIELQKNIKTKTKLIHNIDGHVGIKFKI